MTLRQQQAKFTRMVADLIVFAYDHGYELTFGDAWAKTGHKPNSYHYSRRAVDFNLFLDGVWLNKTEDHKPLGDYWESLDPMCSWGGRWNDGNHYEFHD